MMRAGREGENGRKTHLFGRDYYWWIEDGRWTLYPADLGDDQ